MYCYKILQKRFNSGKIIAKIKIKGWFYNYFISLGVKFV